VNPTYDTELLLIRWILLRWQFFGEGKQFYTDRIGFKFADWTYHITTHAAPRPTYGGNGSDNHKRGDTTRDHFF